MISRGQFLYRMQLHQTGYHLETMRGMPISNMIEGAWEEAGLIYDYNNDKDNSMDKTSM